MSPKTKTIGIRLPLELFQLLGAEATKRRMRASTYAQKLVVDGLTLSTSPIEQKLSELQAAFDRLERELVAKRRAGASAGQATGASADGRPTALREWVAELPPGEE